MKNSVLISAMAFLYSTFAVAGQDETIVVTASGHEQKITDAPASVSVISQQELQKKNYTDLGEALSGIEGVDVRGGTGKTGGLDISIRGMPGKYTLILINGIRQNASENTTPNGFGTMNTAMMPPLSAIDHIEVIRGPMSTLYGSDAMGGVINIITKKSSNVWHGSLNVGHSVQEHGKWGDASQIGFWTSGPLISKTLDLSLRGSFIHRQGSDVTSLSDTSNTRTPYPVRTDNYDFGGRVSYRTSEDNSLWLDGDIARQNYDNNRGQLGPVGTRGGGYTDELHYQRQKWIIGHDTDLTFGRWSSTLSRAVTENTGRLLTAQTLSKVNKGLSGQSRELKNTNTIFDSSLTTAVGGNHLVQLGGEYQDMQLKDGIVLANSGETFHQKEWALYFEDDWNLLDPLTLTWGSRYEQHDSFGGHVSPRAYIVWNALDNWTVKGGISTGYKTPSLSQLHNGVSGVTGNGTISTIGNPGLKPESSVNYETGIYYENDNSLKANVTGFINNFRNAIQSETINDSTNTYRNVGKATTRGIELAAGFPLFIPEVTMDLNYTLIDSRQRGGDNPGAPLTSTARQMANARLNWSLSSDFSTWLAMEYHGKTPRYTRSYNNLTPVQKAVYDDRGADLKPWTVVNLGGSCQLSPQLTVNGTVNNLLDKDFSGVEYYRVGRNGTYAGDYFQTSASTTGYVTPGRNYWLSLNYAF